MYPVTWLLRWQNRENSYSPAYSDHFYVNSIKEKSSVGQQCGAIIKNRYFKVYYPYKVIVDVLLCIASQ